MYIKALIKFSKESAYREDLIDGMESHYDAYEEWR